jgi:arylsulfatase A-like enzyme
VPLHLEDHFDVATIIGSEVPADLPEVVEWRFDQVRKDWQPIALEGSKIPPIAVQRSADALRLTLDESTRVDPFLLGCIAVDLVDWPAAEWAHVLVRARSSEGIRSFTIGFDTIDDEPVDPEAKFPFRHRSDKIVAVNDGTIQTYLIPSGAVGWDESWRRFGLMVEAEQPANFELLSVAVVPAEADYAQAPAGVRSTVIDRVYRRTLYTHAPGRLEYFVLVPEAGRLDVDLGVIRKETPVTFRIGVEPAGGTAETLLEEVHADPRSTSHHSVDLSHLAGRTIKLSLAAEAESPGTVALWGAPTLTGARTTDRPNVIFYVIDGAGADYLSAYGYNRRTTPNLERLAAEGALFEHAYSNAGWTRPSTASFMTSLQHAVLGGFRGGFNVIPHDAPTMAELMHRAGYQTAVFTANPNAGRMSGLERGVDHFKEDWDAFSYGSDGGDFKESSRYLHDAFWSWREQRPGEPYWVHFQTVDVHQEVPANPPFAGLYVGPEQVKVWKEWNDRLGEEKEGHAIYSPAYEKTGVDRIAFFTLHQGLHDENMAHNDYQLGRLVDRLKATGEWERTLLIIGSDHSVKAAMDDMGIALLGDLPPRWSNPMFRPSISRVPLIFVWPDHIPAGLRIDEPVSMIDVLPTILDLAGLPMPEVIQGQSLAPLMLGRKGWERRPVILEQFNADRFVQDEYSRIAIIDGRWGASLEIAPAPQPPPDSKRPVPLLLYDLWNDPACLRSVHEEHPDLVAKYREFLETQFAEHQEMAERFTPADGVALTPEQLRALQALGYVQ